MGALFPCPSDPRRSQAFGAGGIFGGLIMAKPNIRIVRQNVWLAGPEEDESWGEAEVTFYIYC